MKKLVEGLTAHLASGTTTLCWCWRLTRGDGVVFGFTDHDLTLQFDGTSFEPETGLIPSELRVSSGLAVDAQEAEGVLSSDRISESDIFAGLWDNASVEVWRVNWQNAEERVLMRRGSIGQIRRGKTAFVAEVRSMAHVLEQSVGRTFQNACDATLGDTRCKVNLETPAYQATGAITSLIGDRGFAVSGLDEFAANWFALGLLTWQSGGNEGRQVEISRHEVISGVAILTLLEAPVRPPSVGNIFKIQAGCDKRWQTCLEKFSNGDNYRGFPHIPGNNTLIRYAATSRGHKGEPL
ncbi:DUF2163 domain-containing protein [Pseudovibrio sp. Tun.PSC04-5.I4]|uniref:DUF2163 domain-containing protein n=1 Tax=Pseudovibrio sp. Tun.PSC04-5.I4 TaxID=1798213 RepID=UPI0008835D66|nr:DUF2163 domain-containing protein [Pseudovibrio sp. Tun.PSC04-5.I4]SDR39849.1 phage conserved hypothetical protein BR0599 [Pseudovibrio sp. Tun.PSC04-5.I4]